MSVLRLRLGYWVGLAGVAVLSCLLLVNETGEGSVVTMIFLPAVMSAAFIGGRNPGLATTVASVSAALYLVPPVGHFAVSDNHDLVRIITLGVIGFALAITFDVLHRARMSAQHNAADARESELRLATIFRRSPVAKMHWRVATGGVLEINEAFERLFGVRGPAHEQTLLDLQLDNITLSMSPQIITLEHPGLGEKTVLTSTQLIDDRGDRTALTAFVDLTEQRRLERRARDADSRLRELASVADAAFWMVDLSPWRFLYLSPGAELIWGGTIPKDLTPALLMDAVYPADRASVSASLLRGEPCECEFRFVRPDGVVRWLCLHCFGSGTRPDR